jgi:hypothetical protein
MTLIASPLASEQAVASAPASDTKQLSQLNIQALMQNVHDLTDTTPAMPYYFLPATARSWPCLMASGGVLFVRQARRLNRASSGV